MWRWCYKWSFYTASSVPGANWYVWTLPSGWTVTGNANGSSVTVNTSGGNAGNITVTAFASSGSSIKSSTVTFPVVCCITNTTITQNVSTGNTDHEQAANDVTAVNTISGGGSASYHGGINVYLKPGFNALQGSYFHSYNEGCTGNYYRTTNSQTSEENPSAEENMTSNVHVLSDQSFQDLSFTIIPNPSNGVFKVTMSNYKEYPKQIVVRDGSGRTIKTVITTNSFEKELDLSDAPAGLYLVSVYYSDTVINKKMIKN